MSAYIIFIRNKTHDPAGMAPYAELVKSSPAARHGLEMIVSRNSRFQVLEGDPEAEFAVMLRFPTMADALGWYNSEEYRKAREFRQAAADSRVIIVEGDS
ncbi:DUF1330 domain-containing protein [Bradyrhizobium sp. ma5]|uniref:DUF1330 domain-containing protein n=1 Tax=Bradyrhizobium sp. ma5 TaxID=3344828 RepID=UPI0035D4DF21